MRDSWALVALFSGGVLSLAAAAVLAPFVPALRLALLGVVLLMAALAVAVVREIDR